MKRLLFIALSIFVLTMVVKTYAETKHLNFLEFQAIRMRLGNPSMPIVEGKIQTERFVNRCLALAEIAEAKSDTAAATKLRELSRHPYRTFLESTAEHPETKVVETVEIKEEPEITKEMIEKELSEQYRAKSKAHWFEPVFMSTILMIPFLADLVY